MYLNCQNSKRPALGQWEAAAAAAAAQAIPGLFGKKKKKKAKPKLMPVYWCDSPIEAHLLRPGVACRYQNPMDPPANEPPHLVTEAGPPPRGSRAGAEIYLPPEFPPVLPTFPTVGVTPYVPIQRVAVTPYVPTPYPTPYPTPLPKFRFPPGAPPVQPAPPLLAGIDTTTLLLFGGLLLGGLILTRD